MQKRTKSARLQLYVSMQQKGSVLRMYKVSFGYQRTARLLLPRRGRKNFRPKLPRLRKSLGTVRKLKIKKQNARLQSKIQKDVECGLHGFF